MKTINPKPILLALSFVFASTVMVAQETRPQKSEDPLTELTSVKAYNAFVKTLDWTQLNADFKVALEEKYNELIEEMDRKFHQSTKQADMAIAPVTCVYTFVEHTFYLYTSNPNNTFTTHLENLNKSTP